MLHKRRFLIGLVLLVAAAALFHWAAGPTGATSAASGSGIGPNRDLAHAKNYAEPHPVTSIRFLAGCDAERRDGG